MTLIVSLPTSDGILLGTDTLIAIGGVRERSQKINRLSNKISWAGTGEYALIQRVSQQLAAFEDSTQTLKELLPSITNILKSSVRELLTADYRTEIYANNPNALTQLHRADFVFSEWAGSPITLHLNVFGSPQWIAERPLVLGPGDVFAGWLHNRYKTFTPNVQSGTMLTYRMLDETIETGWYGLGGTPDIWQISERGIKQLDDGEIAKLKSALKTIREQEGAIFERNIALSPTPH